MLAFCTDKKADVKHLVTDKITRQFQQQKPQKWTEYKKTPVINQLDTVPYKNCYIIISGNDFSYFREGKLVEKRTMVRNEKFKYEVYNFKEKPDDYLCLDSLEIVLKRDNYDGLHEYFRKEN